MHYEVERQFEKLNERIGAMWVDLEELKFEAKFTRVGTLIAFLLLAERARKYFA